MNKFLKFNQREPNKAERKISYSQYAMYSTCPKHWELAYVKNLRTFSQSIHTIFGTAFHEKLQNYLTVMFNESVKAADEIDINKYLADQMHSLYKEAVEKMGEHFSTRRELNEFYSDGVAILDWFKRKRGQYFSARNEEPYVSKHIADIMHSIENIKHVTNLMAISDKVMKQLEEEE